MLPRSLALTERLREYAGLPEELVAFGDNGAGEAFCMDRGSHRITCWNPSRGQSQPLAEDLAEFWQGWCTGEILHLMPHLRTSNIAAEADVPPEVW
jgi:hypothetical protein